MCAACRQESSTRPAGPGVRQSTDVRVAVPVDAATRAVVAAAQPVPVAATATTPAPSDPSDRCTPALAPQVSTGWVLEGFAPGPAFQSVRALDLHTLAGVTHTRVCVSDDDGAHWIERLHAPEGATLSLEPLDPHGGWLVTARAGTSVRGMFVSHDPALEHFATVTLPHTDGAVVTALSDGFGRVFVATERELLESNDEGTTFGGPHFLPGRSASELDACGPTLIARVRVEEESLYERSFDHGVTWHPFRTTATGVEPTRATARCITERGGVEVGRGNLPTHWSFDGGLTWRPAAYDDTARALARSQTTEGAPPLGEPPHCVAGPGALLACVDTGRARLTNATQTHTQEIIGPSDCEHVRQVDVRRTVAFGDRCGFFVSYDRGGVWRTVSQGLRGRHDAVFADGRGGFIDGRTAWRLDGGVWWTRDAGQHWQPFFAVGARLLDRGVFVDTLHGVFSTHNGWVMATRDGGRTWTYILRGEVERLAAAPPAVIVTTPQSVRVSNNGGVTWLASGTAPPSRPLAPALEVSGDRRLVRFAPGLRITQQADQLTVETDGAGPEVIARGLPAGFPMLAAHATGRRVDRVLLEGGAVLATADIAVDTPAPVRTPPRTRYHRSHGRPRRAH